MALFSITDIMPPEISPAKTTSAAAVGRYERQHCVKVSSLKQLAGRAPENDEVFFLWTKNSFNAFTFITYVIKYFGTIQQLTFSTYSINEHILAALARWYDKGAIEHIHICISDSIRTRVPKVNDQLQTFAGTRNITIGYAWNHSKVTLMKTAEQHFVVCGSGNFSENALHEQYVFLNDERIYQFFDECIRHRTD